MIAASLTRARAERPPLLLTRPRARSPPLEEAPHCNEIGAVPDATVASAPASS